jgi:hypothetical protein
MSNFQNIGMFKKKITSFSLDDLRNLEIIVAFTCKNELKNPNTKEFRIIIIIQK